MPGRVLNPPWSALLAAGLVVGGSSSTHAQQPPPAPTVPAPAPAAEPSAREVVRQANQADAATPANDPVERIKDEAEKRSQVMQTLSYLTDVIGPRLTASPAAKRANEWTRDKLAGWGLENAKLESWGEFGRGWTLQRFSIQVVEPQCIPLIAFPRAWSPGTDGPVAGPVVDLDSIKTEADLLKLKGTLKGAFVLLGPPREAKAHFEPEATRLTDSELLNLANMPDINTRRPRRTPPPPAPGTPAANAPAPPAPGPGGRFTMTPEQRAALQLQRRKTTFAMEEGVAAILDGSAQGDGGTLFVAQASVPSGPLPGTPPDPNARRVSVWDKDAPKILPQVAVSKEHYNRLLRMLRQGEKLTMTLDLAVKFHEGDDAKVYNTVAEIPGTDLKDEVVMLGGHMDSWHSGTGATDNAAGVAVAMEAVRIIKALDLKPRRTIRVALWTGEEQGLYGSKGYVRDHFGQMGNGSAVAEAMGSARMAKLTTKPEYEKFSAYYNLDNGTGKIRGIYLQGNEAARAVFRPWLTPFRDMGASTITISNTSGTDHQSFDGIGLPGFQFIQDVVEYDARTHHSNQDVYERIQPDDMKQASAIMAAFVLNTANRDEKIPRKPAPGAGAPTPPSSTPPAAPAATGGSGS